MPLYEYECKQCQQHTEKIQKFSDPEITVCPHCGGELERVISAPAISFKGGGWFADGYGNAKPSPAKGESSGSDKSSGSTSDSASSSKDSSSSSKSDSVAAPSSSTAAPASAPAAAASASSSSDKK